MYRPLNSAMVSALNSVLRSQFLIVMSAESGCSVLRLLLLLVLLVHALHRRQRDDLQHQRRVLHADGVALQPHHRRLLDLHCILEDVHRSARSSLLPAQHRLKDTAIADSFSRSISSLSTRSPFTSQSTFYFNSAEMSSVLTL